MMRRTNLLRAWVGRWPLLGRLLREERGNAIMIFAAIFPLVVAGAGLAVDGVQWIERKNELQNAADSAALAGTYSAIADDDVEQAAADSFAKSAQFASNASLEITRSPAGHEDDPFAVNVHLTAPAKMTFASMFLSKAPMITAQATASAVGTGQYCAFALGGDSQPGVVIKASSTVELGCGIASNATGPRSVSAESSSSLVADRVLTHGAIEGMRQLQKSAARPYALTQKDPLADTDPPLVPNTGCPNVTVNPGAEVDLAPGCYGNMHLNGPVRLNDGEYILNRGDFVVGPQGEINCSACTIFLTSETAGTDGGSIGKVSISADASVKMSATREGPNAGILFYQDRHAARDIPGEENRIGGNSFTVLDGLLYFPSEAIFVDGAMNPDLRCTRMVAKRLVFQGRVYIAKGCSGLDHVTFTATEVRLIN